MLFLWLIIFCFSLYVLIKAADYFTESAEKIGLALRISPFIIGATIISLGTTMPELSTSLVAVINNQTEIVAANAIGSNIANILLIIGLAAIIAGELKVKRNLIDLDLPLLAAVTALIVAMMWDKQITRGEGVIALLAYLVYAAYAVKSGKEERNRPEGILPGEDIPATREQRYHLIKKHREINLKLFFFLMVSIIIIYFSADWTVRAISNLALLIGLPVSLVVMSGLAVGTSLPELIVSLNATLKGKYEIALGNVFGANIINILLVMGLPAIFRNLTIDEATFSIGIPFVIVATLLYIFTGISKKIYIWNGLMFILIYLLFLAKLFGLF